MCHWRDRVRSGDQGLKPSVLWHSRCVTQRGGGLARPAARPARAWGRCLLGGCPGGPPLSARPHGRVLGEVAPPAGCRCPWLGPVRLHPASCQASLEQLVKCPGLGGAWSNPSPGCSPRASESVHSGWGRWHMETRPSDRRILGWGKSSSHALRRTARDVGSLDQPQATRAPLSPRAPMPCSTGVRQHPSGEGHVCRRILSD